MYSFSCRVLVPSFKQLLLSVLLQGNAALDSLARTWVSAFKGSSSASSNNRALVDLVNLTFCASGATENIVRAEEDVADLDEEGESLSFLCYLLSKPTSFLLGSIFRLFSVPSFPYLIVTLSLVTSLLFFFFALHLCVKFVSVCAAGWQDVMSRVTEALEADAHGPTVTKYPVVGTSKDAVKVRSRLTEWCRNVVSEMTRTIFWRPKKRAGKKNETERCEKSK